MLRKLSLAVAISGLLSPVGVHALGLGDIQLDSALNQRLNAEILIHLAKSEELGDVKVELASENAFSRAGIDRPFILSGLRFNPVRNSAGNTVITVTSREPVREPFLNFLVEVNWPKGRLVREYTVLLDPPVTLRRHAAQIDSPVVTHQPGRERLTQRTTSNYAYDTGEGREYGPVVSNDTLWQIASQMRIEGETAEQVMMALLYNNPDAFVHNNINRLKRGVILRLPRTDEVTSLSRREARAEFLAQTRQWRRQHTRSEPPVRPSAPSSPAQKSVTDDGDRLKLASAKKASSETDAAEGSAEGLAEYSKLEQELVLVRESNEVIQQEGAELRNRVSELEAQLQDFQRLLTLRNDQLAQIQAGQQQKTVSQEAAPVEKVIETDQKSPSPVTTDDIAVEKSVDEKVDTPPEAEEKSTAALEPEKAVDSPAPKPIQQPVAVEPPEPVISKSTEQPVTSSFIDTIKSNSTLAGIAGGVIALLVALFALFIRRRKTAEAEFAESILVTPTIDTAAQPSPGAGLATEPGDETSLLSDFSPSDIDALQDETGEVDPLSEADVYVAYGRYQQAEELIQQAIGKDDRRVELKFKLMEIYYSTQNAAAFTELAQRLSDQGADKENPQMWAQIISMGYELAPGEALFGAAANLVAGDEGDWEPAEVITGADASEELAGLGDIDLGDLGDLETELGQDGDGNSLLNIEESIEGTLIQKKPLNPDETIVNESEITNLSTDDETLDLSDLDLPSEFTTESNELVENLTGQSDDETLDLSDLDLPTEFTAESNELVENLAEQSENETLDLSDLDLPSEFSGEGNAVVDDLAALSDGLDSEISFSGPDSLEIASELGGETLDLEDLGEELNTLSEELESEELEINPDEMSASLEEETADVDSSLLSESDDLADGLSDEDEVDTKIDLARAYADMGDKEGAENILQEVIGEGTDKQKQEAEELIKNLS